MCVKSLKIPRAGQRPARGFPVRVRGLHKQPLHFSWIEVARTLREKRALANQG